MTSYVTVVVPDGHPADVSYHSAFNRTAFFLLQDTTTDFHLMQMQIQTNQLCGFQMHGYSKLTSLLCHTSGTKFLGEKLHLYMQPETHAWVAVDC